MTETSTWRLCYSHVHDFPSSCTYKLGSAAAFNGGQQSNNVKPISRVCLIQINVHIEPLISGCVVELIVQSIAIPANHAFSQPQLFLKRVPEVVF